MQPLICGVFLFIFCSLFPLIGDRAGAKVARFSVCTEEVLPTETFAHGDRESLRTTQLVRRNKKRVKDIQTLKYEISKPSKHGVLPRPRTAPCVRQDTPVEIIRTEDPSWTVQPTEMFYRPVAVNQIAFFPDGSTAFGDFNPLKLRISTFISPSYGYPPGDSLRCRSGTVPTYSENYQFLGKTSLFRHSDFIMYYATTLNKYIFI